MGRVEVMCSFSKELTQSSVKGTYSNDGTNINGGDVEFDTPLKLDLFAWDPANFEWTDAKKEGDVISLGSEVKLEIGETVYGYLQTNT